METSMVFAGIFLLGVFCGITLTICALVLSEVMTDEQKAALRKAWHWLTRANPRAGSDDVGTAEWVTARDVMKIKEWQK